MNLLVDVLPTAVYVKGTEVPINPDFRTFVLFELLMKDDSFDEEEKVVQAMDLFYGKRMEDAEAALEALLWFYRCGKEASTKSGSSGPPVYAFDADDGYIVAAFYQQYHIDLTAFEGYDASKPNGGHYLHWWKFTALFQGLNDSCELVKIMGYRGADVSGMSPGQRQYYQKMKQLYRLPASEHDKQVQSAWVHKLLGTDQRKETDNDRETTHQKATDKSAGMEVVCDHSRS